MDAAEELALLAEKIREAVARIGAVPGEPALPGLADKLRPLADEVQGLARHFVEPPPAPLPRKPAPLGPTPLDDSGAATRRHSETHTPPAAEIHSLIEALLGHPESPEDDRITEDPGSVSKAWNEAEEEAPAPPRSAPLDKKTHSGEELWDDLSSRSEE